MKAAFALLLLVAAAGCGGSSGKQANASFDVHIRNDLHEQTVLLRCLDTSCAGFGDTITIAPARTASVTVATSATNVYVVERDDEHRLGCLVLTYDAVPTKTPVRPLSRLSTCP